MQPTINFLTIQLYIMDIIEKYRHGHHVTIITQLLLKFIYTTSYRLNSIMDKFHMAGICHPVKFYLLSFCILLTS